jgi:hypothetical protein|nr:MAG TPA: hypothetical protein [Caudoviricetes sp.]
MTNTQKLISLLQPKDYVSKIKLYCRDCTEPLIRKVEEQKLREKKIKIEEI